MKTKKFYCLIFTIFICLSFLFLPFAEESVIADEKHNLNGKYDFLPEDVMPILGYSSLPNANAGDAGNTAINPSFLTKANFLTYKEAGFNIVAGLYEREPNNTPDIRKALQLAKETGLTYFVNDLAFRGDSYNGTVNPLPVESYKEALSNSWYTKEEAFGGIVVKDEPSAADFDILGNINKAIKETLPGKIMHSTLFPSYVQTERLGLDKDYNGWNNYVAYVSQYMEKVQPDILIYDHYLFPKRGGTLENLYMDGLFDEASTANAIESYMKTISLYRKMSLKYNTPYWTTMNSYNHRNGQQNTKKFLEWNVNLNLAYGCKGIQYYTYWSSLGGGMGPSTWSTHSKNGLVTENGIPHDTYYNVKEINDNIKVVDDILMKSKSVGVMQFGKQTLRVVVDDFCYGYGLLNNITGGDSFVGCFDYNGKTVYYILNNSISAGSQTFKVDFLDKVNVKLLNSKCDKTLENVYSVGFNLSGGQAMLLEVL